ncbi:anthranilate phosphoribosyltransferase [Bacillus sp. FJAT-44742]|uniref:anthranilate phosphoribosyltransferase n=1 Tax=Bacillus sp. FJAT-44742 TaxID=2014005 RepID=UPI0018E1E488|nr:anthranilate phosphoribosyltransferase [Bacillus sp. FJAT-44742]
MKEWLKEVARGEKGSRNLTYDEAYQAATAITSNQATDAQIGAFLASKRLNGESWEEMKAFVDAIREKSQLGGSMKGESLSIDSAGPYDGRKTFPATIPVAFILAEAGIKTYIHGGRSLPPKYGTSMPELFSQFIGNPCKAVSAVREKDVERGVVFSDTYQRSEALDRLYRIRDEIGIRTFINTVEKLLHLIETDILFFGVFHKKAAETIIPLIQNLPYEEAFVVQGIEGSEDVPVFRNSTFVYHVQKGSVEPLTFRPADYGLNRSKELFPEYPSVQEQAGWINNILQNNIDDVTEPLYAQVLFNAALRLYLVKQASSMEEGIETAETILKSGGPWKRAERWRTQEERER